jgi:AraC family transcriptional regulator, regulatory protein of adaptative response / DNA-3-methyladenine glycosylase II
MALEVAIHLPRDVDFAWLLGFLGARAIPALEDISDGAYRRSLRLGGELVTFALRYAGRRKWNVRAHGPSLDEQSLRRLVLRAFDLESPIDDFLRLARADIRLLPLVAQRPGIALPIYVDRFEGLIRAILGQQISLAAARTMGGRLVERFGEPASDLDGRSFRAFPRAESLANVRLQALRALGFTKAKATALRAAARAVARSVIDFDRLQTAAPAVVQETLRTLPGVGPWTAAYVRMRTLGDRDAFPATDLGVVKALTRLVDAGEALTPAAIESLSDAWRPFRAYATLHLWASLADHSQ